MLKFSAESEQTKLSNGLSVVKKVRKQVVDQFEIQEFDKLATKPRRLKDSQRRLRESSRLSVSLETARPRTPRAQSPEIELAYGERRFFVVCTVLHMRASLLPHRVYG